jgi:hypothetical protein
MLTIHQFRAPQPSQTKKSLKSRHRKSGRRYARFAEFLNPNHNFGKVTPR